MVLDISKLPDSSFREVPFLWKRTSIENKGRKTVTHEFPDSSSKRSVEDLGIDGDIFSISAEIDYSDNFSARTDFINALKGQGSGSLVLPIGETKEVTVVNYNIDDSAQTLGISIFSITFQESEENRCT